MKKRSQSRTKKNMVDESNGDNGEDTTPKILEKSRIQLMYWRY